MASIADYERQCCCYEGVYLCLCGVEGSPIKGSPVKYCQVGVAMRDNDCKQTAACFPSTLKNIILQMI